MNYFEKYGSIVLTSNQFPSQHYIRVSCRQTQQWATKLFLTKFSYLFVPLCPCMGISAKSIQKLPMICHTVVLGHCVQRNGNNLHFHVSQLWVYGWDTYVLLWAAPIKLKNLDLLHNPTHIATSSRENLTNVLPYSVLHGLPWEQQKFDQKQWTNHIHFKKIL